MPRQTIKDLQLQVEDLKGWVERLQKNAVAQESSVAQRKHMAELEMMEKRVKLANSLGQTLSAVNEMIKFVIGKEVL